MQYLVVGTAYAMRKIAFDIWNNQCSKSLYDSHEVSGIVSAIK